MGAMTSSPQPSDLPSIRSISIGGQEPGPTSLKLERTVTKAERPAPGSLLASAQRITGKTVAGRQTTRRGMKATSWQRDAWDMFDLVGEEHFLATVLANRGSQARFYVGSLNADDPLADPEPVEDATLAGILDHVGKTSKGRAQLVQRALVNYFIAGECYWIGIPSRLMPTSDDDEAEDAADNVTPFARPVDRTAPVEGGLQMNDDSLSDLVWRVFSSAEYKVADGKVSLRLVELEGGEKEFDPDELWVIRSWRQHPERGWEPDSPTRSSLPVLRELVGATMAISGQIDSRLAGAGILLIAQKISDAMKTAMGIPTEGTPDEDPFMDALVEAMSTPIADRASASAYVPLGITVPGESVEHVMEHITFAQPLDAELRPIRDEAIRRLALGQDAPPELLLGVGGMNHWGAWLVREDVVVTHIEPPLAIVADMWTTMYLRPAMKAAGYSDDVIADTVVWYSVDHMIARPTAGDDAVKLYDRGELSGDALRESLGFDENDAPATIGLQGDPIIDLALQLVTQTPSLMSAPGLPAIVEQLRAVQEGRTSTTTPAEEGTEAEPEEEAPVEERPADEDAPADGPPAEVSAPSLSAVRRDRPRDTPTDGATGGDEA